MGNKILMRIGNVQKKMITDLLFEYVMKNAKVSKTNRIIRREYQIAKKLYGDLTNKGRLCKTCGQRVKT